jgi:polyisoprenoid-binding protein YceI
MGVASGTYQLGPELGKLLVRTGRSGLGAKAGHDLTIEITAWRGTATVDIADPANSAVSVDVDVDSLEVREGTGGVKPLTDSDRAEIRKTFREKILQTAENPTIRFRSSRVEGSPESFTVDGDLTIMDVTRPVTVRGAVSDGRVRGSARVTQTRWGIKPYTAFFGALKLRDDVEVEFDLVLAAG